MNIETHTSRAWGRQGDPLSPLLFNMVMDELLVGLNRSPSNGGSLGEGVRTSAMAFADVQIP